MDIVRELEFTQEWIELGILTPEKLDEIEVEWSTSADRNTEHYRWRAFLDFIQSRSLLDERTLRCLYRLGANDPDRSMGGAIMVEILRRKDCPEDLLREAAASEQKFLRKIAQERLA